jgi:hypothetical protein
MRRPWRIVFFLGCSTVVFSACSSVFAQDCAPWARACEKVNSKADIFVGRVISAMDETGSIHVQVLRTYRGSVSGEIAINAFPRTLGVGETYLFYCSLSQGGHDTLRANDGCSTEPLSAVGPDELAVLDGLKSGSRSGTVFGSLERRLSYQDHEPLTGIRILVKNGKRTYSGISDTEGKFDISGVPPGVYHLSAELPETLTLGEEELIEIFPRGCFNAYLTAMNNSTIRGRIALPAGIKAAGTRVFAVNTTGGGGREATADSQGRYTIFGLAVGKYVVGINIDATFPSIEAPYPPTYFPGTRDPEKAKKFVISGPAHFREVDISVPVASEIVRLEVKATFEDGQPVQNELIGISYTGYGIRSGERTDSTGMASVPIVRGERFFLMGFRRVGSRCLSPVTVGPDKYPQMIQVLYTIDGCREEFNLTHSGVLHASVHDKFSQVPITVTFPDGSPAFNAFITMLSKREQVPFVGAFLTDKDGNINLPIPSNQEFQVAASVHRPGSDCESQSVLFNTDRGIHWREIDPRQSNVMSGDDESTLTAPIHLVLRGTSCKLGTP